MGNATMLFHRTSKEAATAILRDGFRDATGFYLTEIELRGVFLSDRPLDSNEGAGPEEDAVVLAIEITAPLQDLADFELVEEGKPYREWCIPAELIQRCGKVRTATPDEMYRESSEVRALL